MKQAFIVTLALVAAVRIGADPASAPQGRGRGGPPPVRPSPLAAADHTGFDIDLRRRVDEKLGWRSGVLAGGERRVDRRELAPRTRSSRTRSSSGAAASRKTSS